MLRHLYYIYTCMQLEMHDAAAADANPGGSHGDNSPQEKRHGGIGQQRRHRKLERVLISGFRSAKGLVELTNHILENATSLKQLILDTAYGRNSGRCMCIRPNGSQEVCGYHQEMHPSSSPLKC